MKKKGIKILLFLICVLSVFAVAGCSEGNHYDGKVKVVFELEGGTYSNCKAIIYYYSFENGTENLIFEPSKIISQKDKKEEIENGKKVLEGWYRTKTEDGTDKNGNVKYAYSDKWNFDTDKVTDEGVTLYAKWVSYAYAVCYYDDAHERVEVDRYPVFGGDGKINKMSIDNIAGMRSGYTALPGYYDKDGNVWNDDFVHPQTEDNSIVDVFVKYVENVKGYPWKMVSKANEFVSCLSNGSNVYLLNDIDMNNEEIKGLNEKVYDGVIYGNGHTVKNFAVKCEIKKDSRTNDLVFGDKSILISLFGKCNDAIIKDVTFENVTYTLDSTYRSMDRLIVAPMCLSMTDGCEFTNVTFNGTYTVKSLHQDVLDNKFFITQKLSYLENKNVNEDTVTINFTETTVTE